MGYGYAGNTNSYNNCNSYGNNTGSTFVLIVVLFILLIIVGASFINNTY